MLRYEYRTNTLKYLGATMLHAFPIATTILFDALVNSQRQEISGTAISGCCLRSCCSLKHPVRWVHQAAAPKRHCRVVRVSWLIVSCTRERDGERETESESERGLESARASERERQAEKVSERKREQKRKKECKCLIWIWALSPYKLDTIQEYIRSDTGVRGWRWRHHRRLSVEDGSVACRRGAHGRAAAVCRASAGCVRMAGGARGGVVDCSGDAQVHLMLQCSQIAELFVDVCELLLGETCHRHHFV